MDIQELKEGFEDWFVVNYHDGDIHPNHHLLDFKECDQEYVDDLVNMLWEAWQAAKASVVPETPKREGGYYIRDLRNPSGNCMKFWYQAGYGTKHKNFFWCATLEEARKYKGGCDWFEIWHAPYIDSLVEYTVDFQLADRSIGFVDLKAQEPTND